MEETKTIEAPQIRYHITYDKNLTLKDLEDLINLIRISNNDVLKEMGISRSKANDLQRIEKIEPGSIEFVTGLGVISSIIGIGEFIFRVGNVISEKIRAERQKDLTGTRCDKKVYYRNNVSVNNEGQGNVYIDNSFTVNIHVDNKDEIREILEILKKK